MNTITPGRRAYTPEERASIRGLLRRRIIRNQADWSFAAAFVFAVILLWAGVSWRLTLLFSAILGVIVFTGLIFLESQSGALSEIEDMTDDKLEFEKDTLPEKSIPRRVAGGAIGLAMVLIIFAAIGAIGSGAGKLVGFVKKQGGWENVGKTVGEIADAALSKAYCDDLTVAYAGHIYNDPNGDPDYGYQVTVIENNTREAGKLLLEVILHTTEGTWTKGGLVDARSKARQSWLFDFPEPTLKSENGNISANGYCFPGSHTGRTAEKNSQN